MQQTFAMILENAVNKLNHMKDKQQEMTAARLDGGLEEVIRTLVIEIGKIKTMVLGQENVLQPFKRRR